MPARAFDGDAFVEWWTTGTPRGRRARRSEAGPLGMMTPIELQFLGSGDALGSGGRVQACLHLRGADGGGGPIDLGASSPLSLESARPAPHNLQRGGVSPPHRDPFRGPPLPFPPRAVPGGD